jgi:hypothetical protein
MESKKNSTVKSALCVLVFILLFIGLGTRGYSEDTGTYYWAQGRKIYVDPVPGHYLAFFSSQKALAPPNLESGRGALRTVEKPPEILLPPEASLVRIEGSENYSPQMSSQAGRPIRALVQAYRDHDTGAMVLSTDRIVVRFKTEVDESSAQAVLKGMGLTDIQSCADAPRQFTARCFAADSFPDPFETANRLYERSDVLFCHPDLIKGKKPAFTPNDDFYYDQWHLHNEGQDGGAPGADINIEEAWDVTLGSSEVRLGVVDDGIMKDHEDLFPNYLAGKNFLTGGSDPTPAPESGLFGDWHGTATAGLAVGRGDNGRGISGACPQCGLVAVRYGSTSIDDANAFYWQNQQGVAVSSNSWGYSDNVTPDAVYYAIEDVALNGRNGLGMVILVASGNEGKTIPLAALAAHPDVIAVGASTNQDIRAGYSNYGSNLSVVAPSSGGTRAVTTTDVYPPVGEGYNAGTSSSFPNYANGRYTNDFGGTSAACPQAAGVVGLMLALNPEMPRLTVKRALEYTADKIGSAPYNQGRNGLYGYGRVNAARALKAALAASYTGWWYTPGEEGSGLSIEVQGLALFLTWFAYDLQTGQPTWMTSGALMEDPYHYTGPVLQWSERPQGDFSSTVQAAPAGTLSITFSSESEAELSWTIGDRQGQKSIRKFLNEASPGSKDPRDINGWWYDPASPGKGVFMEARGGNLFVGWHHYGPDGKPRWWSSANLFPQGATQYSGIFVEWRNGQCLGCNSYVPPDSPAYASQVSIQFLDQSRAVFMWDGGQLDIERFFFGALG